MAVYAYFNLAEISAECVRTEHCENFPVAFDTLYNNSPVEYNG